VTEPTLTVSPSDALAPPLIARACEEVGVAKSTRDGLTLLLLGILAGAFIALGALSLVVVTTGAAGLPWGLARAVGGVAFSLGLILVVVGGAELFTGDCLMVVAWASRRITLAALLRAWSYVYAGNLIGAVATAGMVFLAGHYRMDGGLVGKTALAIAAAKSDLPGLPLFVLAVLCNVLVCLAVWMSLSARHTVDKVVVIVPAVVAFVAAGFEHSIANAFFLPYALLICHGAPDEFWAAIGQTAASFPTVTVVNALRNIGISTVGNLAGGSVLVGGIYWLIYLRKR
jgi:formate transporter